MKNRIKNLTPNKIKRITAIITTIICLAYLVYGLNIVPTKMHILLIIVVLAIGSVLALFIYYLLLHLTGLSDYEEKEKAKSFLSKDNFTEVGFFINSSISEAKMLSSILKAEGCKFYAKLAEDDNVLLIVKDKNDDEIYSSTILNYLYFTSHFKQKEN